MKNWWTNQNVGIVLLFVWLLSPIVAELFPVHQKHYHRRYSPTCYHTGNRYPLASGPGYFADLHRLPYVIGQWYTTPRVNIHDATCFEATLTLGQYLCRKRLRRLHVGSNFHRVRFLFIPCSDRELSICSGNYGMWVSNQQFTLRNIKISNAVYAIWQQWNWWGCFVSIPAED